MAAGFELRRAEAAAGGRGDARGLVVTPGQPLTEPGRRPAEDNIPGIWGRGVTLNVKSERPLIGCFSPLARSTVISKRAAPDSA